MALGPMESMTLSEASTKFLLQLPSEARTRSQAEVNRFVRWLGGNRQIQSLSAHEVSGYMDTLGNNVKDLDKRVDPVKAFLAYAKKQGYSVANLGTSLRVPKSALRSNSKGIFIPQAETIHLTAEGYTQTQGELETLKAERPKIAETLKLAMADKDFRENAPLDAARDYQAHVEARIRELEALLKHADVMSNEPQQAAKIQLGHTVAITEISSTTALRLTLVHSHEANFAMNKVSISSPLGKALLDHVAGEEVEVVAPSGLIKYRIEGVEHSN